jgi:tetratricopeptide (TPR) repeat protein
MTIQMNFRVPGSFFFALLPLIGMTLSALSFILLANHLLTTASPEGPFRSTLRQIEWWAGLTIRLFVYYSLLLYANAILDPSTPTDWASQVLSKSGGEVDLSFPVRYEWVNLRSWSNPAKSKRLFLQREEHLWGGEEIIVQTRKGYFGISWVSKLERDEEKHNKKVLELTPTASVAWKRLTTFYLGHLHWKEANDAARKYFEIYPNDYDFALYVGGELSVAGRYDDGINFLQRALEIRPTYEAHQQLGWALSYRGKKERSAEVLETSIPLNPDDWEAYYHLGYVYADLGKYAESLANFKKVLERQPYFPEVKEQIERVQQSIVIQHTAQARKQQTNNPRIK